MGRGASAGQERAAGGRRCINCKPGSLSRPHGSGRAAAAQAADSSASRPERSGRGCPSCSAAGATARSSRPSSRTSRGLTEVFTNSKRKFPATIMCRWFHEYGKDPAGTVGRCSGHAQRAVAGTGAAGVQRDRARTLKRRGSSPLRFCRVPRMRITKGNASSAEGLEDSCRSSGHSTLISPPAGACGSASPRRRRPQIAAPKQTLAPGALHSVAGDRPGAGCVCGAAFPGPPGQVQPPQKRDREAYPGPVLRGRACAVRAAWGPDLASAHKWSAGGGAHRRARAPERRSQSEIPGQRVRSGSAHTRISPPGRACPLPPEAAWSASAGVSDSARTGLGRRERPASARTVSHCTGWAARSKESAPPTPPKRAVSRSRAFPDAGPP